ncbi:hypothetical protein N7468_009778 [Penicillium chermesinum]|uniref:CENP-C homolog n=1 Tax=Penicillium chermesinum TaxID=63820 RepID=A0A9W9TCP9_9EURO|nr:uncharacterized protein N7468_009778 [Penicillium chermesinum]KAJ5216770.1 hypothetical protein N7468_009778 [Penicillium chermesinum]
MARGAAKPRDLDYSALGTLGRRTGISLQERKRDEDGMEEMDGLFSSPEKSPAKLNGFDDGDNEDSMGSDVMSIDEGNGPAPADFFHSAKRPSLLPARVAEDYAASSPSDGKGLNASARQETSPLTTRSVNAGPNRPKPSAQQNSKPRVASNSAVNDFSDDEGDENSYSFPPEENDIDESINAGNETVIPEDDVSNVSGNNSGTENDSLGVAPDPPQNTKAGTSSSKETNKSRASKTADGKSKKANDGRRGRPPKNSRPHDDDESSNNRPPKKAKTTNAKSRAPREPLDPELNKVVENYAQRSGPLKGRSLYILKKEHPEDTNSTHTRSGRVSIRPLAYWRNERCVFGDGEAAEGQRYPMSTIKEVVRTEELEPEKSKRGKRSGRKSKPKKQHEESSDEEDDPNADVWEKEDGILHGYIPTWDSKTQTTTADEEIVDIAYAPSGIKTREVKDSTFRFAKLLSSHFIGSGVVELPKDGIKRPKNSKKMHMVFYVTHGRVQVDISGVQFSAGKGSVFQVPRGNHYSFQNPYEREARLFFTQGCIPNEGEQSNPSEESHAAAPESGLEGESDPATSKASKNRGRPKGKAKAK